MYKVKDKYLLKISDELDFISGIYPTLVKSAKCFINEDREIKFIESIYSKGYTTPVKLNRKTVEMTTEPRKKEESLDKIFKSRKAKVLVSSFKNECL